MSHLIRAHHRLLGGMMVGLSLFFVLALGTMPAAAQQTTPGQLAGAASQNINVWLGPVEVVQGPDTITDNPFHTLPGPSWLLGYLANGYTQGYIGGSLETLRPLTTSVINPGPGFDSCGAWLNSVWQDGSIIRGWYHAETACAYPATRKSAAYAESTDGGLTFVKPNYPSNQVLTAPARFTDPDDDDEGDQRVIRVGNYLHMYFIPSRDWQVRLARSSVADGGRPGTWYKYYQGTFSQPGIGGDSSRLDPTGALTRSWVSYSTRLNAFVGFSYVVRGYSVHPNKLAGYGFTFSTDGVQGWSALPYLALSSEGIYWGRDENSRELVEYMSMISEYGDSSEIGNSFWLYYMYLNPGEGFDQRYLLRRKVLLSPTASGGPAHLVPRIALGKYEKNDDTWFTTTTTDTSYQSAGTIGYLFTDQVLNSTPVYDCYIPYWNDHMTVPTDASCGGGNVRNLRRMGWVSTVAFENSVPVYRCWDAAATNHFLSLDQGCEGKTYEWRLGYLATEPTFPQAEFVALSNYTDGSIADSWATTSKPPSHYAFEGRLGYLWTRAHPNSLPVFDCYIAGWNDHMLDIIPGCYGATQLQQMGWISIDEIPNSVRIYRCWDAAATNHFVSTDPNCNGQQVEWPIGYLAIEPTTGINRTLFLPMILSSR